MGSDPEGCGVIVVIFVTFAVTFLATDACTVDRINLHWRQEAVDRGYAAWEIDQSTGERGWSWKLSDEIEVESDVPENDSAKENVDE